jgi:hypothetical protein
MSEPSNGRRSPLSSAEIQAICDLAAEAVVVMDVVDRSLIELDQFSRRDERR